MASGEVERARSRSADRRRPAAFSSDGDLEVSYEACRRIMRDNASSFTLASRLLPAERRRATHALYGVFRTLDDLVDETGAGHLTPAEALDSLRRWRAWFCEPEGSPPDHPATPAFVDTIRQYGIPLRYFVELTDGLQCDIENRRYVDFGELAVYCYRVASTVGLAMCSVLGVVDRRAAGHAAELGVAMQLTNILRDVREDVEVGRVYLPQDELAAAGWDEARLRRGGVDDAFRALMRRQIARARGYYARGLAGLPYLNRDARLAILVAARVYGAILSRIERRDCDVFGGRARVPAAAKVWIVARCLAERGMAVRFATPAAPDGPTGMELMGDQT